MDVKNAEDFPLADCFLELLICQLTGINMRFYRIFYSDENKLYIIMVVSIILLKVTVYPS